MRILYIDCKMGAAGDMLTAALIELLPSPDKFIEELNSLGIPGIKYIMEKSVKCGICGTHIRVLADGKEEGEHTDHHHGHNHEHHHSGMSDIEHICKHLNVSEKVKADVTAVFGLIAQAESAVHGVPVSEIHFHEVGTMDAIADITAVCCLMEKLNADKIIASPVNVGSGTVKCAHGILPVPAPAAAYILKGVPVYSDNIKSELCTPTGAALLKHFASEFGNMPVMRVKSVGYGMGTKDFEAANCVRAILGETEGASDEILELCCNVDDMTGEAVGFASERLFEAGALDVYTSAIGMKKSRPGTLIHIMCREKDKEAVIKAAFRHTTTIGIRENRLKRYVLDRETQNINTKYGTMRRKISRGYGVERVKYEYDDLAKISAETGKSIDEITTELDNTSKSQR